MTRNLPRALFLCALSLALVLAWPLDVWATTPRRAVVVTIRGTPDGAEERLLEATIGELLGRLQLTMVREAREGVLASVAIDRRAEGARVVVRSSSGVALVDQRVEDDNPAIERERIGHVVRGAVEAELLAEEDRVATAPAPTPSPATHLRTALPPTARPATAPPEDPSLRANEDRPASTPSGSGLALDASLFAAGGPVAASAGPVMRVGGGLGLASRRGLRPSFTVSVAQAFPFEAGDAVLGGRATLTSPRALAGVELFRARWLSLGAGLGGGLDVLGVEPTSKVLPLTTLRAGTTRVDPIATGGLFAKVPIVGDAGITVALVADLDPMRRQYVFDDRGTRGSIFTPWVVRPSLQVGFSFALLGESSARSAGR